MSLPLIITIFSFGTAIVAVIAAKEVIWDSKKTGWRKLNFRGYIVLPCALAMAILPLVQYFIQKHLDEQQEIIRKVEAIKHDAELRKEYENSVESMRREYERGTTHILDTTKKITSLIKDNLNKVKGTLDLSKSLFKNVKNIDTSLNQTLSLAQANVYPISPLDYSISYTFALKRSVVETKFPSIEKYINRGIGCCVINMRNGLRDTITGIDTASLNRFDSVTKSFLMDYTPYVTFKKDSNTKGDMMANQHEIFWLDPRKTSISSEVFSEISIEQNRDIVVVKITRRAINALQFCLETCHLNGIRDIKGWYFTLQVEKKDADSISVSQILFYTGPNKELNLGYEFSKSNGSNKVEIINKKITDRDFIKTDIDLQIRSKNPVPE